MYIQKLSLQKCKTELEINFNAKYDYNYID